MVAVMCLLSGLRPLPLSCLAFGYSACECQGKALMVATEPSCDHSSNLAAVTWKRACCGHAGPVHSQLPFKDLALT